MKSVLLIDVDPRSSEVARLILRRLGYRVCSVRDGGEALALAARENPDLIIPGGAATGPEGRDLRRALGSVPALKSVPILALVAPPAGAAGSSKNGFPAADDGEPPVEASSAEKDPGGGEPNEVVQIPVNPFELLAKVRFLLGEEGRRPPPRLALKRAAEVEAGEIHATGSLLNLSGSGALLETEAAEVIEDPVRLRFSLPESGRALEPLGRVIRRMPAEGQPGRVAVEFVEMDEESRRALESFLFLTG